MLVHTVYFWLKSELSDSERAAFLQDLKGLSRIDSVVQLHAGSPSDTEARPVVDHSYDFGLAVIFRDVAGHDHYSAHQIHQDFLARWKASFSEVRVYDFD